MNELLLIYPYDPRGTISFNFIKNETHKLTSSQGKDYAFIKPLKAPFLEKDFEITDVRTGRTLREGLDYRLAVPFINEETTIKCFRIIEILNTAYHDSILSINYRTIGSDLVFDEIEIMEYLVSIEVNPRSVLWSDILEKPGRYKAEEHLHHIKDFFGMNELIAVLERGIQRREERHALLQASLEDHKAQQNAHNISLLDIGLHRLENLYPAERSTFDSSDLTLKERLSYLTPNILNQYLEDNYLKSENIVSVHLEGPREVTQAKTFSWRITNYDAFSTYSIRNSIGTFGITDDTVYGEFYVTDDIGPQTFTVIKDGFETEFAITVTEAGINTPSILGIANNETQVSLTPSFNSTAFETEPTGKDVLVQCLYQIATDAEFNDIVHFSTSTNTDELELARLGKLSTYYVRVKQIGSIYESPWSEPVRFVTEDIDVPAVLFSPETTIVSGGRYAHDFVVGVSLRNEYYNKKILSAVEYRLTEVIANSTQRPLVAISGLKRVDYGEDKPSDSLRWTPLQSSENAVYGPYGEEGYTTQPQHFKPDTFHELTVRIRLGEENWSDWSAPKTFKTSSVSSRVVQQSETIGEGDSAYTSYYDKEIQTYS
jgi:hypothetical protein